MLVLTILLVTPYANSYDLTLLALPICWIGWEAYKDDSISSFDSFFLITAWCLPILSVSIAVLAKLQIAPFFILCMSFWVFRHDLSNGMSEPIGRKAILEPYK